MAKLNIHVVQTLVKYEILRGLSFPSRASYHIGNAIGMNNINGG